MIDTPEEIIEKMAAEMYASSPDRVFMSDYQDTTPDGKRIKKVVDVPFEEASTGNRAICYEKAKAAYAIVQDHIKKLEAEIDRLRRD